jgi:hypothetical protein
MKTSADVALCEETLCLLEESIELLELERAAIVTLDAESLRRITATKASLAPKLKDLEARLGSLEGSSRDQIRSSAVRLHELALANAALLADAQTAMACALGLWEEAPAYQRKARRSPYGRVPTSLVAARRA